jgi:hypothetical protein
VPKPSTRVSGYRTYAASRACGPAGLIDLLHRYFECQLPATINHDGEVLKFMGDGLFAVFAVAPDNSNAGDLCRAVLTAARGRASATSASGWRCTLLRSSPAMSAAATDYTSVLVGRQFGATN